MQEFIQQITTIFGRVFLFNCCCTSCLKLWVANTVVLDCHIVYRVDLVADRQNLNSLSNAAICLLEAIELRLPLFDRETFRKKFLNDLKILEQLCINLFLIRIFSYTIQDRCKYVENVFKNESRTHLGVRNNFLFISVQTDETVQILYCRLFEMSLNTTCLLPSLL